MQVLWYALVFVDFGYWDALTIRVKNWRAFSLRRLMPLRYQEKNYGNAEESYLCPPENPSADWRLQFESLSSGSAKERLVLTFGIVKLAIFSAKFIHPFEYRQHSRWLTLCSCAAEVVICEGNGSARVRRKPRNHGFCIAEHDNRKRPRAQISVLPADTATHMVALKWALRLKFPQLTCPTEQKCSPLAQLCW